MTDSSGNTWIAALCRAERLPESYAATVTEYVEPLAGQIRSLSEFLQRPVIIGINGAQGSGKSTLALFLDNWLRRESGLSSVTLSLDDLYLNKAERQRLAAEEHPLLGTRGVPGTHDIGLGLDVLDALTAAGPRRIVTLPGFDKASDDRVAAEGSMRVDAPVDVVLFEGWCIGARPQQDEELIAPVNALEANEDADGAWRSYVNDRLGGDYVALFARLDALIMLRVPSFDKVLEWRRLQEQKLREDAGPEGPAGMSPADVGRFVMHFERLTRHMLTDMPGYADAILDIDEMHRIVAMKQHKWLFERASS